MRIFGNAHRLALLFHKVERARHHEPELLFGRLFGVHDAHELAVAEHHDLIAQREHDVEILADEEDARSRLFLTVEDIVDEIGRVDIQPADGIRRNEHVGLRQDLAAEQHLLHVAARKAPHGRFGGRRNDVQLLDDLFRLRARLFAVDEHTMAVEEGARTVEKTPALRLEGGVALLHGKRLNAVLVILIVLEHHVVGDGHGGRKPHAEAVFGDKAHGDALLIDLLRGEPDDGLALVVDPARFHLPEPCDRLAQFALTAARDARNAQNLAAADEKAQIFDGSAALVALYGEIADLQKRAIGLGDGALDVELHLLPHHHLGERRLRRLGRIHAADTFALAEHGDAVGDRHDLVQFVRDDNDGLSVRLHRPHDGEELFRLLRGEDGGRLVEDEDIRAAVKDFDDLHRLLFGDGHIVDLLFGIELEAVFFGDGVHFFVDALCAVAPALCAEHDVLRRRENIDELEVLVHHTDPVAEGVLRGGDDDLLTVYEDLPFVGIVDARDHIHERGLSAPVFAEQGKDLPLFQREADPLVRGNGAEILADVSEFKREISVHLSPRKNV